MLTRRTLLRFAPLLLALTTCLVACVQGATPQSPSDQKGATATVLAGDPVPALRQRPLRLPRLKPGAPCVTSPARRVTTHFGLAQGNGPAYATIGAQDLPQHVVLRYTDAAHFRPGAPANQGWGGLKVLWFVDPAYHGFLLVRGHQLDGTHEVRFNDSLQPELIIDASGGSQGAWTNVATYTRLQAPGCYAYQVDGDTFSYSIVFQALPE